MDIKNMLMRTRNHLPYTIADLCDWVFVDGHRRKRFNINNPKISKQMFSNTKPKTIFVKTDCLYDFLTSKFIKMIDKEHQFILITGDGDLSVPFQIDKRMPKTFKNIDKCFDLIIKNKQIKKWCAENCDTIQINDYTIYPYLLGVVEDNQDYLLNNIQSIDFSKKIFKVLCQHRTHKLDYNLSIEQLKNEQFGNRMICNKYGKTTWKNQVDVFNPENNSNTYLKTLSKYTFVICAQGGGLDPCPRLFEAILMGTIPILKSSSLDSLFINIDLPVVIVDDWNSNTITDDFLKKSFDKYKDYYENIDLRKKTLNKLTMKYWWDYINLS